MLKKARERANVMGAYIDAVLGDAQILPFADNTFDCVCSRNLVWNLEMPQTAYREWLRVLKPGGILLIFDGNHYRYLSMNVTRGYTKPGKSEAIIRCWEWMPA